MLKMDHLDAFVSPSFIQISVFDGPCGTVITSFFGLKYWGNGAGSPFFFWRLITFRNGLLFQTEHLTVSTSDPWVHEVSVG